MMQKVTERPGVTHHLRIAMALVKTSPTSLTGDDVDSDEHMQPPLQLRCSK